MFNFGGPGWFNDVFTLNLTIDNGVKIDDCGDSFTVPWHAFTGINKVFEPKSIISGKVSISPPSPHAVWHGGVILLIEEYLAYLEPYVSSDVISCELKILDEGYLKEPIEILFEYDLSKILPAGKAWSTDYNGKNFALRHIVCASISRPWYTFNVVSFCPIGIYASETIQKLPTERTLAIHEPNGNVECLINSRIINLFNEQLEFSISISPFPNEQINSCRLIILRAESVEDKVLESVVSQYRIIHHDDAEVEPLANEGLDTNMNYIIGDGTRDKRWTVGVNDNLEDHVEVDDEDEEEIVGSSKLQAKKSYSMSLAGLGLNRTFSTLIALNDWIGHCLRDEDLYATLKCDEMKMVLIANGGTIDPSFSQDDHVSVRYFARLVVELYVDSGVKQTYWDSCEIFLYFNRIESNDS